MSSNYRFVLAFAMVALLAVFVSAGGVEAGEGGEGNHTFTGQLSGTVTSVPVDIFGTSCVPNAAGITICTPTSGLGIFSGSASGGPFSGPYTGQAISQIMPVPGGGCGFFPTGTACTENKSNPNGGCLYTYLPPNLPPNEGGIGGAAVFRLNSTGDLFAYYIIGGSLCIDTTSLAFTGTNTSTCSGGTGKGANCFGTTNLTSTFSGQIMIADPAGNAFDWFSQTFTGTVTR